MLASALLYNLKQHEGCTKGGLIKIGPAGTIPNNAVTQGGLSRENRCCTLRELLDLVQLLCE